MAVALTHRRDPAALWHRIAGFFSFHGESWPDDRSIATRRDGMELSEPSRRCSRECGALMHYQTCLAGQLAAGGFDPALSVRCCCERGGGSCVDRLH